jgi:hypothetical protein
MGEKILLSHLESIFAFIEIALFCSIVGGTDVRGILWEIHDYLMVAMQKYNERRSSFSFARAR